MTAPPKPPAICPDCEAAFLAEAAKHPNAPVQGVFCPHHLTTAAAIRAASGQWLWFMVGPMSQQDGYDVVSAIMQGFHAEATALDAAPAVEPPRVPRWN